MDIFHALMHRVHCVLFFSLQSSLREGGIKDLPPIEKNGGGSLMSTAKYGNYKPENQKFSNLNPSLSVSFCVLTFLFIFIY